MRAIHGVLIVLMLPVIIVVVVLLCFLVLLQLLHLVRPGETEKVVQEILKAIEALNKVEEPEKRGKEAKVHPLLEGATILSQVGGGAQTLSMTPAAEQAYTALLVLGFPKATVVEKLGKAMRALPVESSTEDLIKWALKP